MYVATKKLWEIIPKFLTKKHDQNFEKATKTKTKKESNRRHFKKAYGGIWSKLRINKGVYLILIFYYVIYCFTYNVTYYVWKPFGANHLK